MKLLKTLTIISTIILASSAYAFDDLEQSHAEYWEKERQIPRSLSQSHVVKNQKTKYYKVARKPVLSQKKANLVVVAKQYEGLDARRHRVALRNLMDIDPLRIPWCAGFVNAVLYQSGVQGTSSLQARSFLRWGVSTRNPQKGDIVVFTRGRNRATGHVGFYIGQEVIDGVRYILVLGGNQNKAVNVAYYPANKLLGFRTLG